LWLILKRNDDAWVVSEVDFGIGKIIGEGSLSLPPTEKIVVIGLG
jgi:hypothetical protein